MKRYISFFLTIIFFFGIIPTGYSFEDVDPSTNIGLETQYLIEKGVIDGNRSYFYPYQPLTRAELTKLVLESANMTVSQYSFTEFTDMQNLPNDAVWARNYIVEANNQNIIQGYSDGSFQPWTSVTWAEALKIILRTLHTDHLFLDMNEYWWNDYITFAQEKNYLDYSFDSYNSTTQHISRGEVIGLLYKILKTQEQGLQTYAPERKFIDNSPEKYNLVIPDLNVNAPIVVSNQALDLLQSEDWDAFEQSMQDVLVNGVAFYPMTAYPGSPGNTVIFGHSSYYENRAGNYKTIFSNLSEMKEGNIIELVSDEETLRYMVTHSYKVAPTAVEILEQDYSKSTLTLVTCYPTGSIEYRWVVKLEKLYY